MGTELAALPTHADARGCQPVVIVDTTGPPCVMPFASTLNRALELLVEHEITIAQNTHIDDGFPFNIAHLVVQALDSCTYSTMVHSTTSAAA